MKKDYEEGEIKITIDLDKCTGAGECAVACPVEIFEVVDGKAVCKNVGECIECCACVNACPNTAIEHTSCQTLLQAKALNTVFCITCKIVIITIQ